MPGGENNPALPKAQHNRTPFTKPFPVTFKLQEPTPLKVSDASSLAFASYSLRFLVHARHSAQLRPGTSWKQDSCLTLSWSIGIPPRTPDRVSTQQHQCLNRKGSKQQSRHNLSRSYLRILILFPLWDILDILKCSFLSFGNVNLLYTLTQERKGRLWERREGDEEREEERGRRGAGVREEEPPQYTETTVLQGLQSKWQMKDPCTNTELTLRNVFVKEQSSSTEVISPIFFSPLKTKSLKTQYKF